MKFLDDLTFFLQETQFETKLKKFMDQTSRLSDLIILCIVNI